LIAFQNQSIELYFAKINRLISLKCRYVIKEQVL